MAFNIAQVLAMVPISHNHKKDKKNAFLDTISNFCWKSKSYM